MSVNILNRGSKHVKIKRVPLIRFQLEARVLLEHQGKIGSGTQFTALENKGRLQKLKRLVYSHAARKGRVTPLA